MGCLELHVPPSNRRGRPRVHTTREILDVVFFLLGSGCPWRLLYGVFPPLEIPLLLVYAWATYPENRLTRIRPNATLVSG
jgi:transposase